VEALDGGSVVLSSPLKPSNCGVGRGQALIDQLPWSRHLDVVETQPFRSGSVVQVYRPERG
jgi:hypothetical protein